MLSNFLYRVSLKYCAITILLFILSFLPALSQDKPNSDLQFQEARTKAFDGKYTDARLLLSQILSRQPGYTDAAILMGRTYAWEGKFTNARAELQKVLAADPDNQDAINALIDVGLWSENPDEAITYANIGLNYYPNFEDFLLKKAKALIQKDALDEAAVELNRLLTINPANEEALRLLQSLKKKARRNFVGVQYYLSLFDNGTNPWHLVSAEYGRVTRRVTVIGRLNYANRNNQSGYQGEIDAYPILGKGTYAYLNAGYSPDTLLFPRTRFGAELFQKLPKDFEISGGVRILNFPRLHIILYTASLSKYYRDFLFTVRGYASFQPGNVTPTVQASIRKYFNNGDSYIMLTLSKGTVPAIAPFASQDELQRLSSSRVAIDFQKAMGRSFYLLGGAWYEYEEYTEALFRNRYTLNIGLQKRF